MFALLIRHAQVPVQDRIGMRAELALSAEGEASAAALAERLQRCEIAAIYSSRLRRTMQTANAIAAVHHLKVRMADALIEVNPGEWENRSFEELAADSRWKYFNTFRSGTRIPAGEMMIEVQVRVVTFLEKLSGELSGRTIAIISHADVIRAALCHYIGIPLDLSVRMEISPASVSVLQIEEWGARLVRMNDTGELVL